MLCPIFPFHVDRDALPLFQAEILLPVQGGSLWNPPSARRLRGASPTGRNGSFEVGLTLQLLLEVSLQG